MRPDPLNPSIANGDFETTAKDSGLPTAWYYLQQMKVARDEKAPSGRHYAMFENETAGRPAPRAAGVPGGWPQGEANRPVVLREGRKMSARAKRWTNCPIWRSPSSTNAAPRSKRSPAATGSARSTGAKTPRACPCPVKPARRACESGCWGRPGSSILIGSKWRRRNNGNAWHQNLLERWTSYKYAYDLDQFLRTCRARAANL